MLFLEVTAIPGAGVRQTGKLIVNLHNVVKIYEHESGQGVWITFLQGAPVHVYGTLEEFWELVPS